MRHLERDLEASCMVGHRRWKIDASLNGAKGDASHKPQRNDGQSSTLDMREGEHLLFIY